MFEEDVQNLPLDSALQKPKIAKPKTAPLRPTRKVSEQAVQAETSPASASLEQAIKPTLTPLVPSAGKPSFWFLKKKFWWGLGAVLLILIVGWFSIKLTVLGQKIFQEKSPWSFFTNFGRLISAGDSKLAGEEEGRINILLLGIGGTGHEGALLTDTIILASLKPPQEEPNEAELALLSIPRDLVVKLPEGLDFRKINSAYAYGELKQAGLGAVWVMQAVQELSGQQVSYYALIDFAGFRKIIDDLGGVEVDVERTFSDSYFPDYRYGYLPTIRFEQGLQPMDGEKALQFARSRHGTSGEGSDFARSQRQQKVLLAVKEKVVKLRLPANLPMISRVLSDFADHFRTNLAPWEIKRVFDLTHNIKPENVLPLALDHESGLVCNEVVEDTGAFVVTPCPGKSRSDIHLYINNAFAHARFLKETSKVEFQNGTKVNFLAQRVQTAVSLPQFTTTIANFPGSRPVETTTIYDLSNGQNPQSLEYLKDKLTAAVSTDYPYPDSLSDPRPDFVVVLGLDAAQKFPAP